MNGVDASVMECEWPPGQLMRMVATQLAAHGFKACGEEPEDDRRLSITDLAGMRCWLMIEDCGTIECEYVLRRGWKADPGRVAALVISRLAGDSSERQHAAGKPGILGLPLRTVVGRELIAAGLDVELAVYPDLADFKVLTDLVVTNPDHPERGEVIISDDGSIVMECDCWEGGANPARIEEIAASIASDIRHAIAKFNAAVSKPTGVGRG